MASLFLRAHRLCDRVYPSATRALKPGSTNGDTNQGAGRGEDIFICVGRADRNFPASFLTGATDTGAKLDASTGILQPITDVLLSTRKNVCPSQYQPVQRHDGLNGDLSQGAGGKTIGLCISFTVGGGPIYDVQLSGSGTCPQEYVQASKPSSLNGNLNQETGGRGLFICISRSPSRGVLGAARDNYHSHSPHRHSPHSHSPHSPQHSHSPKATSFQQDFRHVSAQSASEEQHDLADEILHSLSDGMFASCKEVMRKGACSIRQAQLACPVSCLRGGGGHA